MARRLLASSEPPEPRRTARLDAEAVGVEAVEKKLTLQREFVLRWDDTGERRGNPNVTGLKRLEDYGVNRITIHRWRRMLKDEVKYHRAVAALNAAGIFKKSA